MLSTAERFWIAFILRFAFGFLFLFASLNIFNYGVESFAKSLSGPIANTWVGDVEASIRSLVDNEVEFADATRDSFTVGFLTALPYIMCGLAVCILTGIFLRPALRIGAVLFILLGLGKYLQNDVATTAQDFLFALMICIGLYFLGLERRHAREREDTAPGAVA